MVAVPASNMLINNLACLLAKLLQLCPTLCDPIDSSPPGSSVPGIFQAGVLEWGATASCLQFKICSIQPFIGL